MGCRREPGWAEQFEHVLVHTPPQHHGALAEGMDEGSDVDLAIAAAEAGAAVVQAKYGAMVGRHDKTVIDFATDADLEAEQVIFDLIHRERPSDAVIGEEYGVRGDAAGPRRWLIDPLCATANFAARTPLFCVNVALQIDAATAVAAIADPVSGETFWLDHCTAGTRRGGADDPATASSASRLVDINLDPVTDGDLLGARLLTDRPFRAAFGQRVLSGTLPLAWVAVGRRAAYVSDGNLLDSVHFTAGLALCRAAGCVVTDLRGRPLHTGPGVIAAADDHTHATLLEIVTRHLR